MRCLVEPGRLLAGEIAFSFQRYPRPPDGIVRERPRSYGALPVALSGDSVLVPLPQGEAIWIGVTPQLSPSAARVGITADTGGPRLMDALAGVEVDQNPVRFQAVGHGLEIDGIRRASGETWAISRAALGRGLDCRQLRFHFDNGSGAASEIITFEFVHPQSFRDRSGQPAPAELDPGAAYGGWLLP